AAADGGDGSGAGRPGGSAGEVLMAAVRVGTGGGELLLLAGGKRGIGRCNGHGHQYRRCHSQAGGAGDGAGSGLNGAAACGHASCQTAAADGGDGSGAGRPGGGAGEVLMAAVRVGTGGGELLLLAGGNRGIRGGYGDCHQGCRCNGEGGG